MNLGLSVPEFQMQEVLPQQVEAFEAHMDCHVPKATQEGEIKDLCLSFDIAFGYSVFEILMIACFVFD